ncbi:HET-domain-containing protein [Xylariaceae sp. AK1471]|nr:HET-domain-containing protein [Xylariaceae sp. AK1471]
MMDNTDDTPVCNHYRSPRITDAPRIDFTLLNDLCSVCSTLNLAEYFKEERDYEILPGGWVGPANSALSVGLLRDICIKAQRCSFCWILVQSICTTNVYRETSPEALLRREEISDKPMECCLFSYCFAKNDRIAESYPQSKAVRVGIATRVRENIAGASSTKWDPIGIVGDIQLLGEDALRLRGSRVFYGRQMNQRLDLQLLDYWLDLCHTHHDGCREGHISGLTNGPKDLLVVDVKRRCVTNLPPGARYMALSYCWPSQRTLCTTNDNITLLSQPGSLQQRIQELPLVIADTIELLFELGETFLWVDALCIIQDNDGHKATQIAQMDKVYMSAWMTIVPVIKSLDADEACVGLPRYNPNIKCREQKVASVHGMNLTVPFEAVFGLVTTNTRWNNRAWTYQECLLSRRILFLTESQAYFQCQRSIFCEDCRGEIDTTDVYIAPGTNLWNPGGANISTGRLDMRAGSFHLPRDPYKSENIAILAYSNYLTFYTSRHLTNASDSLNAFQGIANVLEQSMQTSFYHGLPEKFWDIALLFNLNVHRSRLTQPPDKYPRNRLFPSWSWAGWDCGIENGLYFPTLLAGVRREVDWFLIFNDDRDPYALNSRGRPGIMEFPSKGNKDLDLKGSMPSSSFAELTHISCRSNMASTLYTPTLLACWTMVADFYLPGLVVPLGHNSLHWASSKHLAICNGRNDWVGSIVMGKEWIERSLDKTGKYRFIVLSRSEKVLIGRTERTPPHVFDTAFLPERPWCLLNVMMVESIGGIFERLGVGVIHEDMWLQAQPTSILAVLR